MGTRATFSQFSVQMFEETPDVLTDTITNAVLYNHSMSKSILKANIQYGLDRFMTKFHDYAATDYFYGNPQGTVSTLAVNLPTVKEVLESLPGHGGFGAVENVSGSLNITDIYAYSYQYLQEAGLYFVKDKDDYLIKVSESNIEQGDLIDNLGDIRAIRSIAAVHNPIQGDPFIAITVNEKYTVSTGTGQDTTVTNLDRPRVIHRIPNPPLGKYYNIRYELNGQEKFWSYDPETNVHPTLDLENQVEDIDGDNDYFPIIPLRHDKQNLNDIAHYAATSLETVTSRELLDKININMDDIITQIDGNPDVEDIDDVFVYFGANIYSEIDEVKEYVFKHFNSVANNIDYNDAQNVDNHLTNSASIRVTDFEQEFKYNYIRRNTGIGTLKPKGTYWSEVILKSNTTFNPEPYPSDPSEGAGAEWAQDSRPVYHSELIVYYQQSASVYTKIKIHGFHLVTKARSRNGEYRAELVVELSDPSDAAEEATNTRNSLNVPLSKSILDNIYDKRARDVVIYQSLRLNIIGATYQKTRWYDGIIRLISNPILQVFLAIITLGQSLALQAWTAAFVAGTMTLQLLIRNIALLIIKGYLKNLLIDYTLQWIATKIGGTFGIILNAIIVVASTIYGGNSSIKGIAGLPFSEQIMTVVNGLERAIGAHVSAEFDQLADDWSVFESEYDSRAEELQAAQDLLNNEGNFFNPLYVSNNLQPITSNLDETPTEYYNRTIHTANPGVLSLDAVGYYVDGALTLPKVKNDFKSGETNEL